MRIRLGNAILAALAVGLVTLGLAGNVAAAGATMKVVPSSATVAKDGTFTIRVVHNSSTTASGAQATVTFDKSKVQVKAVERGHLYASSPVFAPTDMAGAISKANSSGKLEAIAAAFLPPDSVPVGEQDFLIITFSAIGCGKVDFGLPVLPIDHAAEMLDGTEAGYGTPIQVTTSGASVTVDCSGAVQPDGGGSSANPASSENAAPASAGAGGAAGATDNPAPGETVAAATSGSGGNTAISGNNTSPGSGSGSGGSLPLWLPLLLAIPALLLIGFVLLRRPLPTRS